LHWMSFGVILRHDWSLSSDWRLCCRDLFSGFSINVFQLPGRILRGYIRDIVLHWMSCGVILRHDWSIRSNWQLCCRDLFSGFSISVFQLPGRILCSNNRDVVLCKLLGEHLSILEGIDCVHFMFCGIILRHDGSVRCNWKLFCGNIFSFFCVNLLKLSDWKFPNSDRIIILL